MINRIYVLDKYGYPVETFKGEYIKNFIRYIIHINFKNTILHYLGKD